METTVTEPLESHRTQRSESPHEHGIVSARVRPGLEVTVVNVSSGGALIDAAHRLLPGSGIELQLSTRERHVSMRGRVLRCSVARLYASQLCYRAAIGFDRHLPWLVEIDRGGYGLLGSETRATRRAWGDGSRLPG